MLDLSTSTHRLQQWTTGVSNPVRYPCFRLSASVLIQKVAFASGIPSNLYEFYPSIRNSTFPYQTLVFQFWNLSWSQATRFIFQLKKPPTDSLHPVIPNNTCPPRITAAAGTELAGTSSSSTVIILPDERALQPNGLHHSRDIAGSGFRPLSKIPHCCLPRESGPCLSPSVADHPLRPAKDRRLGELLPHQLPILTKAYPTTINLWLSGINTVFHRKTFSLSKGILIPDCRVNSRALRTRSPLIFFKIRSTCMC